MAKNLQRDGKEFAKGWQRIRKGMAKNSQRIRKEFAKNSQRNKNNLIIIELFGNQFKLYQNCRNHKLTLQI